MMAAIMAGQGTALQALRVGLMAMIVCNLVFLGLLLANVRLAVVQLYSRRALKLRGMAMLAGESVALGLLIVESPIATLAAGGLLLAVSVVLRFEIMKLPQAL